MRAFLANRPAFQNHDPIGHADGGKAVRDENGHLGPGEFHEAFKYLVLSHRVMMTPEAELDGTLGTQVVSEALDKVGYRMPKR